MPSPFPGMDPFLEAPAFFSGLHIGMMFCLREALQLVLPEPYYAEMADRTWVEVSQRDIEPDVNVLRGERSPPEAGGGVAVAQTTATPPCVIRVPHTSFREVYLDIFARLDEREQVVAAVEILSLRQQDVWREKGAICICKNSARSSTGRFIWLRLICFAPVSTPRPCR